MKKYLALARVAFQGELFYRVNFFFFFIRQTLWFLVKLLLVAAIFKEKQTVASYDFNQMVQYFVIVYLTGLLAATRIDYQLGRLIRRGELSFLLLKPYFFLGRMFALRWGKNLYRFVYILGVLLALLVLGVVKIEIPRHLVFVFVLINASLLIFLYRFILGAIAFWLINIDSVFSILRQAMGILGGGWLPMAFFPDQARKMLQSLPFYLTLGFPAEFFQGRLETSFVADKVMEQLIWIIFLSVLSTVIWRQGVKHYEAAGN